MYGLPIDVVCLATDGTNFFVGKMDGGKIVKEVNPIKGMRLPHVHRVHGGRDERERKDDEREGRRSNKYMGGVIVDTARPDRKQLLESITFDYNYRCCLHSSALE